MESISGFQPRPRGHLRPPSAGKMPPRVPSSSQRSGKLSSTSSRVYATPQMPGIRRGGRPVWQQTALSLSRLSKSSSSVSNLPQADDYCHWSEDGGDTAQDVLEEPPEDRRSDFSRERYYVDCLKLRDELEESHTAMRQLSATYLEVLEGDLMNQMHWALEWQRQLCNATAAAVFANGQGCAGLSRDDWLTCVEQGRAEMSETQRILAASAEAERTRVAVVELREDMRAMEQRLDVTGSKQLSAQQERARLQRDLLRCEELEADQQRHFDAEEERLQRAFYHVSEEVTALKEAQAKRTKRCDRLAAEIEEVRRKQGEQLPMHLLKSRLDKLHVQGTEERSRLAHIEREGEARAQERAKIFNRRSAPVRSRLKGVQMRRDEVDRHVEDLRQRYSEAMALQQQRQELRAVVQIQRRQRGIAARSLLRDSREAAIRIQSAARMRLAWKRLQMLRAERWRLQQKSAVSLQCAWRSKHARQKLEYLKERKRRRELEYAAATRIQKRQRGRLARQEAGRRRERRKREHLENCTALRIQSWWRGSCARWEVRRQREKEKSAAVVIQSVQRRRLATREMERRRAERRRQDAAVKIQSARRSRLARQELERRRLQRRRELAVLAMQGAVLRWRAWQELQLRREDWRHLREAAAVQIQSASRRKTARKELARRRLQKQSRAAVKIQAAARGKASRELATAMREKNTAAIRIQSCTRGRAARLRASRRRKSVVRIQAAQRRRLAQLWARKERQRLQRRREEEAAAIVLQSSWRGVVTRRQVRELRDLDQIEDEATQEWAACAIQQAWRNSRWRRRRRSSAELVHVMQAEAEATASPHAMAPTHDADGNSSDSEQGKHGGMVQTAEDGDSAWGSESFESEKGELAGSGGAEPEIDRHVQGAMTASSAEPRDSREEAECVGHEPDHAIESDLAEQEYHAHPPALEESRVAHEISRADVEDADSPAPSPGTEDGASSTSSQCLKSEPGKLASNRKEDQEDLAQMRDVTTETHSAKYESGAGAENVESPRPSESFESEDHEHVIGDQAEPTHAAATETKSHMAPLASRSGADKGTSSSLSDSFESENGELASVNCAEQKKHSVAAADLSIAPPISPADANDGARSLKASEDFEIENMEHSATEEQKEQDHDLVQGMTAEMTMGQPISTEVPDDTFSARPAEIVSANDEHISSGSAEQADHGHHATGEAADSPRPSESFESENSQHAYSDKENNEDHAGFPASGAGAQDTKSPRSSEPSESEHSEEADEQQEYREMSVAPRNSEALAQETNSARPSESFESENSEEADEEQENREVSVAPPNPGAPANCDEAVVNHGGRPSKDSESEISECDHSIASEQPDGEGDFWEDVELEDGFAPGQHLAAEPHGKPGRSRAGTESSESESGDGIGVEEQQYIEYEQPARAESRAAPLAQSCTKEEDSPRNFESFERESEGCASSGVEGQQKNEHEQPVPLSSGQALVGKSDAKQSDSPRYSESLKSGSDGHTSHGEEEQQRSEQAEHAAAESSKANSPRYSESLESESQGHASNAPTETMAPVANSDAKEAGSPRYSESLESENEGRAENGEAEPQNNEHAQFAPEETNKADSPRSSESFESESVGHASIVVEDQRNNENERPAPPESSMAPVSRTDAQDSTSPRVSESFESEGGERTDVGLQKKSEYAQAAQAESSKQQVSQIDLGPSSEGSKSEKDEDIGSDSVQEEDSVKMQPAPAGLRSSLGADAEEIESSGSSEGKEPLKSHTAPEDAASSTPEEDISEEFEVASNVSA